MIYKIVSLLLFLTTLQACAMSSQKFLELHISSENINYYVMLNDVEVFDEVSESPVTNVVPVSHWALNGKNSILVSVDFKEENTNINALLEKVKDVKLTVSLKLRVKTGDSEDTYQLTEFDIHPSTKDPKNLASSTIKNIKLSSKKTFAQDDEGEIQVFDLTVNPASDSWLHFEQKIDLSDFGLDEWSYLSADVIDESSLSDEAYYALSDQLYLEYKKLWELFKAKKTEQILDLIKLRTLEYDKSYHLESGTKLKEMERSLQSAFNHEELFLSDIVPTDNANLNVMANGRIFNLKIAGAGEPLIYYSHKRGSFTRFYDFYFMRKNGKWIIIR